MPMYNDLKRNRTEAGEYIAADADEAQVYADMRLPYVMASDLAPAEPTQAEKYNAAVAAMAKAVAERERKKATQAAENERAAQRAEAQQKLSELRARLAFVQDMKAPMEAFKDALEAAEAAKGTPGYTAALDTAEAACARVRAVEKRHGQPVEPTEPTPHPHVQYLRETGQRASADWPAYNTWAVAHGHEPFNDNLTRHYT